MAYESEFSNRKKFLNMNVPSDNTELIKIAIELRPKVIKALASKFEHTLTKEDIDDGFLQIFYYALQ